MPTLHTIQSLMQETYEAAEEHIYATHYDLPTSELEALVQAKYRELLASLFARPDLLQHVASITDAIN